MSDIESLMKRCRAGTIFVDDANCLHADCYGALGRLRERVEELEKQTEIMVYDDQGHFITTAQIDAMVEYANDEEAALPDGCQGLVWDMLNIGGIVACEECNTDEKRHRHAILRQQCPSCHGHGWVIGGDDE